jgi:hypothetical protein
MANEPMKIAIKITQSFFMTIKTPQTQVVVQFDVRQALACRRFGDKLKFVGLYSKMLSTQNRLRF